MFLVQQTVPGPPSQQKRLQGWWSHDKATRFDMKHTLKEAAGAQAFSLSNPGVLLMMCLIASLRVYDQTSMERLRIRSKRLTAFLQTILDAISDLVLASNSTDSKKEPPLFRIITPSDPEQRGAMLCIKFADGELCKAIHHKVEQKGVVIDYRRPDALRIAPAPLYNTFSDLAKFATIFKSELMALKEKGK